MRWICDHGSIGVAMATVGHSHHLFLVYISFLWQAILQKTVNSSCVEYEKVVNGSGYRLKTCPLDKPPSFVYCCVDSCCEEPHLAILVTSILGGFLICVIGIGLVILCIIDLHKVTCDERGTSESPLLSEEDDEHDVSEDTKTAEVWYKSETANEDLPPVEISGINSTPTTPCDVSQSTQSNATYLTEVPSIPPTPVEHIHIPMISKNS